MFITKWSQGSAVDIATAYGLDDQGVPVVSEFSLLHIVQTGSGAYAASYPMGTRGSFPKSKAAGFVKLTTHRQLVPRSRKCGSVDPLPHMPSWHSA
jgi:hypothetical protein